ncbi:hypothetical protein PAXRUDRAFT_822424 [Paxillus rubicundulus Ve08.2h10]|uniref:Uncharacterized protein n=1 Tax=Paxillus rubicundulus Ve08.2h10 TaxID=930991 RepID=A0A0D0E575_9AGAM|nr:hypothetical protein PAXRUDRAFT_822424 [Paxillus rubicundulus Ve08.2h10]
MRDDFDFAPLGSSYQRVHSELLGHWKFDHAHRQIPGVILAHVTADTGNNRGLVDHYTLAVHVGAEMF